MTVARRMVALAATLIVTLALGVALTACSSGGEKSSANGAGGITLLEEGKLIVGSDCDYPPFIYMDGDTPAGFEYDLMQAVGADLGYTVEYLAPQNFDGLFAGVAAGGKMDIGVSSFTITDERKELVDFSDSYYDANQACVVMGTADYASTADLEGKTVGAQSGTTGESWANENIPGITMKPYNQTSEALAALRAGEVEAVFFDSPVAEAQVKTTYQDTKIIEVIPTGEQYGIAVNKDNPELLAAINASLAKLKGDGTFEELLAKHFG